MISELFIEQSVVFHNPLPLSKPSATALEKVEQNSDNSTSLVFGSTFPKGGLDDFVSTFTKLSDPLAPPFQKVEVFGSTKSPPTSLEFGSTFPKGGKGGLISLKAVSSPLTALEQDFIFQIDCSGSMSDICSDGRTKMQHILHTLKNMILYFKENPSLKVNVTIHAFDDTIYKIIDRTLVDEKNYNKIITNIDKIVPRNCTNIEKALQDTNECISQLSKQHPHTIKTHIFMTDGQVTAGNIKHTYLRELVDNSIANVFIGFGLDHDATLLNVISEPEKSSYYFIDKLENAGLVYGEILHGIVYKFLENVEISITDGLVYDYNTNTWNSTLKVGDIASESSKFYHITGSHSSVVQVTGRKTETGEEIQILVPVQEELADLTKYLYRQRTQELLFRINSFNKNDENNTEEYEENFQKLKTEMQELFDELKKYMADNNLTDDTLLKNLCDDIYICRRTFGTIYGNMYCTSRGNSQGQQRAYATTYLPDNQRNDTIRRQHAIYRSTNRINAQQYDYEDDEDIEEMHHDLSDSIETPYRTQTMSQVMRCVSTKENNEEYTIVEF